MEMEHINENTIRVLIGNEDLADRGITFLDLLGNHREIESFFYSILEEVDVEDEFKSSEAVTFQVLPKKDGLELFISKNMSQEEFNKAADALELESGDFDQLMQQQILSSTKSYGGKDDVERVRVFALDSFENLIELANYHFLDDAWCDLYQFNGQYYLLVFFDPEYFGDFAVTDIISEVLEYTHSTTVSPEVLDEYGKMLMRQDAIETTRNYFK
ncbi:adaptor protein MecA [Enterococcus alishanensis]|uniref:Adapter protein MecA n=1 Tax=Enterococcus alishanensis TaxID=1303817 RepID=A0ABS6TF94_9ENTE|nr:adaptor protein MecA [Enterococcus alishanensis]MBV7391553.1 adaptor protein MecA [Enterococcus alishanensis]